MTKQRFSSRRHSLLSHRLFRIMLPVLILISGMFTATMIPSAVKTAAAKVNTVFPEKISYTPYVSCTGTIEYDSMHSITCNVPVVIKSYNVYEGARVDEGQVIAEIDKDKTLSQLTALYGTSGLDNGKIMTTVNSLPDYIEADRSGVIFSLSGAGELIDAGNAVAKLGEKGNMVVKACVPERDISKVGPGQTVSITANATEGSYSGKVSEISSCARKVNNGINDETVVDVIISIDNPTDELKSGFSAEGKIMTGLKSELLTLPYSAVCQDDDGEYVYVFSHGTAVRRDITTGVELPYATQVNGVEEGDEVILSPDGISSDTPVIRITDSVER